MVLDWNQYREQLLKAIGDLGRLSPQTVRGYRELSDAGTKTARLARAASTGRRPSPRLESAASSTPLSSKAWSSRARAWRS
jgi:hypothetical protein